MGGNCVYVLCAVCKLGLGGNVWVEGESMSVMSVSVRLEHRHISSGVGRAAAPPLHLKITICQYKLRAVVCD